MSESEYTEFKIVELPKDFLVRLNMLALEYAPIPASMPPTIKEALERDAKKFSNVLYFTPLLNCNVFLKLEELYNTVGCHVKLFFGDGTDYLSPEKVLEILNLGIKGISEKLVDRQHILVCPSCNAAYHNAVKVFSVTLITNQDFGEEFIAVRLYVQALLDTRLKNF